MTVEISVFTGASHTEAERREALLQQLVTQRVASRIFSRDTSLWGAAASSEAARRLGWTDITPETRERITEAEVLREKLRDRGITRVLLCGMGGSSLAPAVIAQSTNITLDVLDTTHPDAVARALDTDLSSLVVVISSKSGTTVETLSHRALFADAFTRAGLPANEHMIVVTDPGSPLEASARAAGEHVFLADPSVGGRFSALTTFGVVPPILAGADVRTLLADTEVARAEFERDSYDNSALQLAATLGAGLPQRFILLLGAQSATAQGLCAWIEQLVAESTGKAGHGLLPLSLAADEDIAVITSQRSTLQLTVDDAAVARHQHAATSLDSVFSATGSAGAACTDSCECAGVPRVMIRGSIGAQFLLWEVATVALASLLQIDPFNQPDVEFAKVAARAALMNTEHAVQAETSTVQGQLTEKHADGFVPDEPLISSANALREWSRDTPGDGYIALQAYVDTHPNIQGLMRRLQSAVCTVTGAPTALGWGPRYLHSVGQLHKGGPSQAAFLQIVDQGSCTVAIPGTPHDFGRLMSSQAAGDRAVLRERGRQVAVISLGDVEKILEELNA